MNSIQDSTEKRFDFLFVPTVEWPKVSDLPLLIEWPTDFEDTVELEIAGF